jgi:hypothetical protein
MAQCAVVGSYGVTATTFGSNAASRRDGSEDGFSVLIAPARIIAKHESEQSMPKKRVEITQIPEEISEIRAELKKLAADYSELRRRLEAIEAANRGQSPRGVEGIAAVTARR